MFMGYRHGRTPAQQLLPKLLVPALLLCWPGAAIGLPEPQQDRYIGHAFSATLSAHSVVRFDPNATDAGGDFVAPGSGGLSGGTGVTFGPDGALYVGSSATDEVLKFDGKTGDPIGTFVSDERLLRPFSLIFGPEGALYVSSGATNEVLRFDGETGAFVDVVAEGLRVPIGLRFGPDGWLYIANAGAGQIVRMDPSQPTVGWEVFIEGGLSFPSDLVFAPDGKLYVSSAVSGEVFTYRADSGQLEGTLVDLPDGSAPVGLDIDLDGNLIVADFGAGRLLRVALPSGEVTVFAEGIGGPENVVVRRE